MVRTHVNVVFHADVGRFHVNVDPTWTWNGGTWTWLGHVDVVGVRERGVHVDVDRSHVHVRIHVYANRAHVDVGATCTYIGPRVRENPRPRGPDPRERGLHVDVARTTRT